MEHKLPKPKHNWWFVYFVRQIGSIFILQRNIPLNQWFGISWFNTCEKKEKKNKRASIVSEKCTKQVANTKINNRSRQVRIYVRTNTKQCSWNWYGKWFQQIERMILSTMRKKCIMLHGKGSFINEEMYLVFIFGWKKRHYRKETSIFKSNQENTFPFSC